MINANLLSNYADQPITTYTASEPFNVHWVDRTTTIDQLQFINTRSFNHAVMDRFYDTILYGDTQWYKNDLATAEKVSLPEDEINVDSIQEAILELLDEVTE